MSLRIKDAIEQESAIRWEAFTIKREACIEALKKATNIQKVDQIIIAAEKEWNPWKEEWQDEVTKLGIKREKELAS